MKKKKKRLLRFLSAAGKNRLIGKTKNKNKKKNCSLIINIPTAMQADLELNKKLTTDRKAVVFLLGFT